MVAMNVLPAYTAFSIMATIVKTSPFQAWQPSQKHMQIPPTHYRQPPPPPPPPPEPPPDEATEEATVDPTDDDTDEAIPAHDATLVAVSASAEISFAILSTT